jgi:hypothetical protein
MESKSTCLLVSMALFQWRASLTQIATHMHYRIHYKLFAPFYCRCHDNVCSSYVTHAHIVQEINLSLGFFCVWLKSIAGSITNYLPHFTIVAMIMFAVVLTLHLDFLRVINMHCRICYKLFAPFYYCCHDNVCSSYVTLGFFAHALQGLLQIICPILLSLPWQCLQLFLRNQCTHSSIN